MLRDRGLWTRSLEFHVSLGAVSNFSLCCKGLVFLLITLLSFPEKQHLLPRGSTLTWRSLRAGRADGP